MTIHVDVVFTMPNGSTHTRRIRDGILLRDRRGFRDRCEYMRAFLGAVSWRRARPA